MFPTQDQDIERSLRANFPSAVLTMMSVVLGVALGNLTQNAIGLASATTEVDIRSALLVFQAILVFVLIVGMFHMYNYYTAIVFSAPSFLNTLPFFLVGCALVLLANAIDTRHFWTIAAVFYGSAALVCVNTLRRMKTNIYAFDTEQLIEREVRKNRLFFLVLFALTVLYAFVSFRAEANCARDLVFGLAQFALLYSATKLTRDRFLQPLFEKLSTGRMLADSRARKQTFARGKARLGVGLAMHS